MIVVTGAAGFIASYLAEALNAAGHQNLVLVDDFSTAAKKPHTCLPRLDVPENMVQHGSSTRRHWTATWI
jgi:nucleoside-diphosphate-sugar epimerase